MGLIPAMGLLANLTRSQPVATLLRRSTHPKRYRRTSTRPKNRSPPGSHPHRCSGSTRVSGIRSLAPLGDPQDQGHDVVIAIEVSTHVQLDVVDPSLRYARPFEEQVGLRDVVDLDTCQRLSLLKEEAPVRDVGHQATLGASQVEEAIEDHNLVVLIVHVEFFEQTSQEVPKA